MAPAHSLGCLQMFPWCGLWSLIFICSCHWLFPSLCTSSTKMQIPKGQGWYPESSERREAVSPTCFKVRTSYLLNKIFVWSCESLSERSCLYFSTSNALLNLLGWKRGEKDEKIRVGLDIIIYTLFLKVGHCWHFYLIASLHRNSIIYISINSHVGIKYHIYVNGGIPFHSNIPQELDFINGINIFHKSKKSAFPPPTHPESFFSNM